MSRSVRALVLGLAVVAVLLPACSFSRDASGNDQADGDVETGAGLPRSTTSTTAVTLVDPGVAPGTCDLVVYTPPAAPEAEDAELCVPAGSHRDVGIVLVHGGGGKFGDHTGVQGWSQAYGADDYVTLAIDYHLFDTSDRKPVFPRPEQDVKAAVQFLRGNAENLDIDPQRIVVQGQSAGARLGAVAHTTGNDPYFSGPNLWPGIPDHVNALIGFYSTYDGTLEDDGFYYGGERDDDDPMVRRRWAHADALANASHATGPAVFFSGDEDWSALITQMEQYVDALEDAGLEGESTVVEGGEHGFDQAGGRLSSLGEQLRAPLLWWLDAQFPQD